LDPTPLLQLTPLEVSIRHFLSLNNVSIICSVIGSYFVYFLCTFSKFCTCDLF